MTAQANLDWYQRISDKRGLPLHCPIAGADKCPRYFMSLDHAMRTNAMSIQLAAVESERLEKKWSSTLPFVINDSSVASYMGRDGRLRGFSNYCPELMAEVFGEFCSDLRDYPDSEAHRACNALLDNKKAEANDPHREWMIYSPKHFSECTEFAVHGDHTSTVRTKSKSRKNMSPRQRFQIFARDGYRCVYCGATGDAAALHVDHKISIAEGGDDEPENLVTACECCNLGKGASSATLPGKG